MDSGSTRGKILIIDDDIEFPYLLGLILKDEGFEITAAHDGEEGVQQCRREAPDLVIVDASMPQGLSGWEVTQQIRSLPNGSASVPIIMLTGYADEKYKHQADRAGVDGYLTKPVLKDTLVQAINRLLDKQTAD